MERRDRSLKALERLNYIDSLEDEALRAQLLLEWSDEYLGQSTIEDFDLELDDLHKLSELFYKNINFLKQYRVKIKEQLDSYPKIREFLK